MKNNGRLCILLRSACLPVLLVAWISVGSARAEPAEEIAPTPMPADGGTLVDPEGPVASEAGLEHSPDELELENEPAIEPPAPPRRPAIDPALRQKALGNTKIGSTSGPRALKHPKNAHTKSPWLSEIELGATGYRGNTDSDAFLIMLKTERKTEVQRLRLSARMNLGNKDGKRDRENSEVEAGLRRDIKNRFYYTAEARYFTDEIADLDYQVVGVLSPGYAFIDSKTAHLGLEIGPAYVAEKKGGLSDNFAALRVAIMMDKLINERMLVWEQFQVLPAIEDTSIYMLLAEAGVESIFNDRFRLRTMLQIRHDSDPAKDKDKRDLFLSAAFVIVF